MNPVRILQRLLYPIYQEYNFANTDRGDTAIKGGSLTRAIFERHAVAVAITRTRNHVAGFLWDLEAFFNSLKTYIVLKRMKEKGWNPIVALLTRSLTP